MENTTYQINIGRSIFISIIEINFFKTKPSEKETAGPYVFTGELYKNIQGGNSTNLAQMI